MAENMKKYCSTLLFVLQLGVSVAAWADTLQDPTRPPAGINDSGVSSGLMTYTQVRGLQSVIISPSHCAAIIDGKTVELGARHGNELLVDVTEYGVEMLGANGHRRALRLFPAVGMKATAASSLARPAVTCKLEQNSNKKKPADAARKKEKK